MPDPMSRLSTRFLRTPEAARYLSLSGRTLEKHRTYGAGPAYRKIGGRVIYALGVLSRALMVHPYRTIRRKRYGTSFTRLRQDDGGSPSSNTE
ncbi:MULTISPECIES: helix-turn-helix transcriptional regulator [Bradyrhizobium]|uniref:helix-turn-helix transcriptional regulator n=1 Tax=Bradyrhizobium pachyrhizi TaxID=280333 RepID=UPI003D3692E9